MKIDKKLKKDIEDYCSLNNINVDDFINKILKKSFLLEKYGDKPNIFKKKEEKVVRYLFHYEYEKKEVDITTTIETEEENKKTIKKRKLT